MSSTMTYQVSYVVKGDPSAGKIEVSDHYPKVGERVTLNGYPYKVVELQDLIPARAEFCYVHVVCEPL